MASGFFPGSSKNFKYLFAEDLLCCFYHTQHLNPGTSQEKFIAAIENVSETQGRVIIS
jgi:hypothetical protein